MRFLTWLAVASAVAAVGCSSGSNYAAKPTAAAPSPAATVAALPTLAAAASAGSAGAASRINSTVQSSNAGQIALADGTTFHLAPNTRISRLQAIKATDLKVGQFVAITGQRQPDNTLLATIVSIFPDSLANVVPGGQRSLPEGNLMTNASIESINGNAFTVTFSGGGARVTIAPGAQLLKQVDATAADLTPGTRVSVALNNGAATSLFIE